MFGYARPSLTLLLEQKPAPKPKAPDHRVEDDGNEHASVNVVVGNKATFLRQEIGTTSPTATCAKRAGYERIGLC